MNPIHVIDTWTIDIPWMEYAGWPTLLKSASGALMAVYSGRRSHHVCPFGQVHLISSSDEGKTWTWPRALVDGALDDRDAGILQTSKSTFIVSWFTSLTWEWQMSNAPDVLRGYSPEEQAEWKRRSENLTDAIRQRELGAWSIRSADGGVTWSNKIPTLVGNTHGPCELSDGRLLLVGKKVAACFRDGVVGTPYEFGMGAAESIDDGQSWKLISDIAPLRGHESEHYCEPHAVQAANGDIIAHIRNHNELHRHEVLQTESKDGGHSWSEPHPIGVWGYPSFLFKAGGEQLIASVGHRREPNGNQVSISEDNGKTWLPQSPINTDSGGDFGYPTTTELSPGVFLSLWYDRSNREQTYLRLAKWRLG